MRSDEASGKQNATACDMNEAERERATVMNELNRHIESYPINLSFPAVVSASPSPASSFATDVTAPSASTGGSAPLRTDGDFINLRLLESLVSFDETRPMNEITPALTNFVAELKASDCYDQVQVWIRPGTPSASTDDIGNEEEPRQTVPSTLEVQLTEKNWYRLYVGGGLKHDSMSTSSDSALLPKVQFETSLSLLNLRGVTDRTVFSYTIDQTASPRYSLNHNAPLYSLFGKESNTANAILLSSATRGSKWNFNAHCKMDTTDHESSRSYKEFVRGVGVKVENGLTASPETSEELYQGWGWNLLWRDCLPRRHPDLPYACFASPYIVSQSGTNVKHSLEYTLLGNGTYCDDKYNPTEGFDFQVRGELAGPPGDVGFWKLGCGGGVHLSLLNNLAMHVCGFGGLMRELDFGGLCGNGNGVHVSDKFFAGGPMSLRGFGPSGIGMRQKVMDGENSPGDALGGEIAYTSTLALSTPLPFFNYPNANGPRLFAFANGGTLSGWGVPTLSLLRGSRISLGAGVCFGSPVGRVEMTYAVPLRYGPNDVRKSAQIGFGFSFG